MMSNWRLFNPYSVHLSRNQLSSIPVYNCVGIIGQAVKFIMGKNNKHIKHLKSERAKLKLRVGKNKTFPNKQNIIDASFKVSKIKLREQLKQQLDEIVSKRNLNVKVCNQHVGLFPEFMD